MSGGTLMVWVRVCSASIGGPAAIRPITGTGTGRLPSSSEAPAPELRTLPSVPSMTLGVKPRRPLPWPPPESSGSLMTSMARARFGRRRMKPRSSSAVMSRWIPDFQRRSSASFISSKEGGTGCGCKRRTYHKCPCRSEIPEQRTVLMGDRGCDQRAVGALLEAGAQVILALVVGGEIAAEQRRLSDVMDAGAARQRANQRHQKQEAADIGGDGIARQAHHAHCPEPAIHHPFSPPPRAPPQRHGDALCLKRL